MSAVMDMRYLIRAMIQYQASDLHLKIGRPPLFRIHGKLVPSRMEELGPEQLRRIIYQVLSERQSQLLDSRKQVDFSFRINDLGRFRCNVYFQRNGIAAAIRTIPDEVPRLEDLHLPKILKDLCHRPRGLVLVTGATGSGKSTTLAAMVREINENRYAHIVLVEDPIEFIHKDQKSSISQRELGQDIATYEEAVYGALRQDPDVIVLGELRDYETIKVALNAADTGRLVLSTLHTQDAKGSLERIIDVFPSEQQNQVRIQLASSLVGVLSQHLVLRKDGKARIPACEIMIKSPLIEGYIYRNEISKIGEAIAASSDYYQMQTINMSLESLILSGQVTEEEALKVTPNPDELRLRLAGIRREEGYETVFLGKDIPPIVR